MININSFHYASYQQIKKTWDNAQYILILAGYKEHVYGKISLRNPWLIRTGS